MNNISIYFNLFYFVIYYLIIKSKQFNIKHFISECLSINILYSILSTLNKATLDNMDTRELQRSIDCKSITVGSNEIENSKKEHCSHIYVEVSRYIMILYMLYQFNFNSSISNNFLFWYPLLCTILNHYGIRFYTILI